MATMPDAMPGTNRPSDRRHRRDRTDRNEPCRPCRIAAGFGLAAVILLAWSATAAAHVTIQPPTAAQGGYAKLTFRVPTEKDVPTIKVAVKFPESHPFAAARVKPLPGWSADIKKKELATPIKTETGEIKEGVDTITWSGGSIGASEFQEFEVSLGPLPKDVEVLYFPTIQTYQGGEEVLWSELPEGTKELDHPAPKLTLTPAVAAGAATTTTTAASGASTTAVATAENLAASPADATSSSNSVPAWIGLGLGAVALVLALVALARSGGGKSTA